MNVNTQIYIIYFSLPGGIIIMGWYDENFSHSFFFVIFFMDQFFCFFFLLVDLVEEF